MQSGFPDWIQSFRTVLVCFKSYDRNGYIGLGVPMGVHFFGFPFMSFLRLSFFSPLSLTFPFFGFLVNLLISFPFTFLIPRFHFSLLPELEDRDSGVLLGKCNRYYF